MRWTEQKMPHNLATSPRASGQQKTDGGMPLHYEFCQRPFPIYLLHMHRTCFHNQPPPPGPDDSGPATENDNSTTGADENPSHNGEEENETTRHSSNNSPRAAKSEPVQQQQQHNGADVAAKKFRRRCSEHQRRFAETPIDDNGIERIFFAASFSSTSGDGMQRRPPVTLLD